MNDWQAIEEWKHRWRDGLDALAGAISTGCECIDCRRLGQWVPIPQAVPDFAEVGA